ncbi:hypothetical protein MYO4S_00243 [Serratia phage 4S]|nr:hypothetical protein MYO4S_00243 [Serratia phage 4S]
MIIIGSAALVHNGLLPEGRKVQDQDYLCTMSEYEGFCSVYKKYELLVDKPFLKAIKTPDGRIYEFNIINTKSDKLIQAYVERTTMCVHGVYVPAPGTLLAIKMSHRFKKNSPHFIKTMKDIHWLRHKGVKMTDVDQEIMRVRQQEVLSYKHPKLDVSKKEFFDDQMGYIYDHDTIHEAIAIGGHPAYKNYMVDGSEVMTSREKFEECPHILKLAGVYEESCVLALERCLIPNDFTDRIKPEQAFYMALSKVCTSITSGWFREFAWEHYLEVSNMYQRLGTDDFVKRFKKNQHMLKPFK